MVFGENEKDQAEPVAALPHCLQDYLELVDWTGRAIRDDKKGFTRLAQPKLLNTLKLSEQQWRILALEIQKTSVLLLNGLDKLQAMEKQSTKSLAA